MNENTAIVQKLPNKVPVKFKRWIEFYFDKNNEETYGNATQSALRAYNTKSYGTASVIGHENRRKLEQLIPQVADSLGHTLPKLLKELYGKANTFDELERYIVRIGYFTPEPAVQVNATQNNQFNFTQIGEQIAAERKSRNLE